MAATLVATLPAGDDWPYEAKFDRYRALARKDGASVRLLSRKDHALTTDYPGVVEAMATLPAKQILLDGELVAFDANGQPSFQQLQHRASRGTAIRYFAFDLLHLNGRDLLKEPLQRRKAHLRKLLTRSLIEFSDNLPGSPEKVMQAVTQVGLEGVMAKRRDSRYEPGVRSRAWLKLKLQHRQEFVVGGFKLRTRPSNPWVLAIRAILRHSSFVGLRDDKYGERLYQQISPDHVRHDRRHRSRC
jgi:bifunctional non-homologous end joining protein LigD